MDLVKHGINGWMTNVEDVEGLTNFAIIALTLSNDEKQKILDKVRITAEQYSYRSLISLWQKFMEGFGNPK